MKDIKDIQKRVNVIDLIRNVMMIGLDTLKITKKHPQNGENIE